MSFLLVLSMNGETYSLMSIPNGREYKPRALASRVAVV